MSAVSSRTGSAKDLSQMDAEKGVASATQHDDKPQTTLREDIAGAGLEAVYARHGRIDLIPMPSDSPDDPLNWPSWKKHVLLFQVGIHAMMGPFAAAAVIPAFVAFVEDFGISITQASYFVSVHILFISVFPLLWSPISARIGRRPMFLGSALTSAGMHLAGAYTTSYATMMTVRVMQAIFISPPQSIGAELVGEVFFQHEKGQKLGLWALFFTIGPPLAPLLMGFVVYHQNWRWIFYILAVINLVQFLVYIPLAPETLYDRPSRSIPGNKEEVGPNDGPRSVGLFSFKRHSKAPWSQLPFDVVRPIQLLIKPSVILPILGYSVVFSYTNVLLTVEIPALLGQKYELNAQQTGLQFIAPLLGAVLGEPFAGWGSDKFVAMRTRRANGNREPEMRLPFALPGYIIAAVGLIVFGVQLENTQAGVWSVTPAVGCGIALFGLQLVTTVCFTYAIESQARPLAQLVPLFVALFRGTYAFTAPFYLTDIFETLGGSAAGGLLAALSAGVGFITIVSCMIWGRKWRGEQ